IEGLERDSIEIYAEDVPVEKPDRLAICGVLTNQFHIHMRPQVVNKQFTGRRRTLRNEEINPIEVEVFCFIEMHIRKINANPVATEKGLKAAVDFIGIHQAVPHSRRCQEIRKVFGGGYRSAAIIPEVYNQFLYPFRLELLHQFVQLPLYIGGITTIIKCRNEHIEHKIPSLFTPNAVNSPVHDRLQLILTTLRRLANFFTIGLAEHKVDLISIQRTKEECEVVLLHGRERQVTGSIQLHDLPATPYTEPVSG